MRGSRAYGRQGLAGLVLLGACGGEVLMGDGMEDAGELPQPDASTAEPDAGGAPEPAEDASVDAALPEPDPYGVCSSDGWCFERPFPTGQDLASGLTLGTRRLLLGSGGSIIEFDGTGFQSVASGLVANPRANLRGSFAFDAQNAWAVGDDNTVLRYGAQGWSPLVEPAPDAGQPLPENFRAVWGASPDDVWVVGEHGALWHYDGELFEKVTSPSNQHLVAVWGTAANDVWVLGQDGALLRYDGMTWTQSSLPGGGPLHALAGASATDVWVVGAAGRVLHFDGQEWQKVELLTLPEVDLFDVELVAEGELLAVGSEGATYHYDGAWHARTSGTRETLRAIVPGEAGAYLTLGDHGTVIGWDGETRRSYAQGAHENYLAIFDGREGGSWIVGDAAYRRDGAGLTAVDKGTPRALHDGFAVSPSSGFAVGTEGTILRLSDGQFTAMDSRTDRWLRGVWAANESSAWVVGDQGLVLGLLNGASWQATGAGTNEDLYAVWGVSASDAWLAGDAGTIAHWDGARWEKLTTGSTAGLRALWGSGSSDVWAAGTLGTLLHWNGKAWSIEAEGQGYTLHGLGGKSASEVYAVGSGGTVLRYDGDSWQQESVPTDVALFSVLAGADGVVRAVGEDGVILYRR